MRKNYGFGNKIFTPLIWAVLLVICSADAARGQDFPYALERETELSPRNIGDYKAAIERYRTAACLPVRQRKSNQDQQQDQQQRQQPNSQNSSCTINEAEAERARDFLILAAVGQIDLNYQKHRRNSRRTRAAFETLMDFLTLGADFAAVITNGVRPKTIISAASGFAQLSRDSATKNLRLQEAQVLFNKMDAKRANVLRTILTNIRGNAQEDIPRKRFADYPFEMAWLDIIAYYRAGTFDEALADLSADTGQERREQENAVLELKGVVASPVATVEDRDKAVKATDVMFDLNEAVTRKAVTDEDKTKKDEALKKLKAIAAALEVKENLKKSLADAGGASTANDGAQIYSAITKLRREARSLEAWTTINFINTAILQNQ